jgi:2-polyprenyl-3-methyl-5-hydroxy-6-metoxy-1,4-benzoquinol methylase
MRRLTVNDAVHISKTIYRENNLLSRLIQRLRPYICPYEIIIGLVPECAEVLDIGCGAGLFLGLLSSSGVLRRGVGIDISARAIENANKMKKNHPTGNSMQFYCIKENEPWPDGQFQIVSMIDVMHHVPAGNQAVLLKKALSKVSTGGLFIYKDVVGKPLWKMWGNTVHDLIIAGTWPRYLPVSDTEHIAKNSGFILKHSRDTKRFWYWHELRIFQNDNISEETK